MFENIDEGIIEIGGNLYVTSQEALEHLLTRIREVGYEVDNLREPAYREHEGVSIKTMEQSVRPLWHANLSTRRGKCKSCGGYIDLRGIQTHGHTCERCGEVTYYKIIDGSRVRFSFISRDDRGYSMADITMKAKWWDTEAGFLYFYPEVHDGLWLRGERATQYFNDNKDKWEEVTIDGKRLIRVKYPYPFFYDVSAINPTEIYGHYWNHRIVLVWEGREYNEYSRDFPLRQSFSIYEAWRWAPLKASPTLHKEVLGAIGNHDDKAWHYQDGRPWFSRRSFVQMGKFVRYFTTLDAAAWDEQSKNFRLDGPGGIDDVASFCHPGAEVENRPNIGNVIVGFGNALHGEYPTANEMSAMVDALKDPEEREKLFVTFGCQSKK